MDLFYMLNCFSVAISFDRHYHIRHQLEVYLSSNASSSLICKLNIKALKSFLLMLSKNVQESANAEFPSMYIKNGMGLSRFDTDKLCWRHNVLVTSFSY